MKVINSPPHRIDGGTSDFGPKSKLQATIKDLCHKNPWGKGGPGGEGIASWMDLVHQAFGLSDELMNTLCSKACDKVEFEALANQLWNKSVVLKSKVDLLVYAKLRYISFQVVAFAYESSSEIESLKKLIVMGLKTAKAWIECKDYSPGDRLLKTLNQTVQKLHCIIHEKENAGSVLRKEKTDMDKDLFHVLCLEMEMRVAQGRFTEALKAADMAKELLVKVPDDRFPLSMLLYNAGVDSYQGQQFDQAVTWLKESYSVLKEDDTPDKHAQAQTLRLLSTCYIDWHCDDWATLALTAITLANQEHLHFSGLFVHVELLLRTHSAMDTVAHALQTLLNHPQCDSEASLSTLSLLKKHNCISAAFTLRQLFLDSQSNGLDPGVAWVMLMEMLTGGQTDTPGAPGTTGLQDMAHTFAQEVITAHNSGQRFDDTTKKQLHVLFWRKAATHSDAGEYGEAIPWYRYSLSLYTSVTGPEPNLAKLHRNLANCYISVDKLEKARKSAEMAEICDPGSPVSHFLIYKIAIATGDKEKALTSLQKLTTLMPREGDEGSLICLAAHKALEMNQTDVAIPALEGVISQGASDSTVIAALRCLCRLMLDKLGQGEITVQSLVLHIRTAYNRLLVLQDSSRAFSLDDLEREATWFMRMSWNLALQAGDDAGLMKEMFTLCSQLLSLCSVDAASHDRTQNCLLMASSAALQMARDSTDTLQVQNLLEEVLQHIEEYKLAERRASNSTWAQVPGAVKSPASSDLMVLMFEFESLHRLKDPRAESVLERATTLPHPDPKLFHNLAALAMSGPSRSPGLCMRALRVAIRLHLQADTPDLHRCSADVRQLVEMAMTRDESEALTYFRETLDVIEKQANGEYPETEILWLMTRAWNHGLQYLNCGKTRDAELWCSLSMKLLKYISSRENYDDQMMTVYGELMSRLEREPPGKAVCEE